MLQDQLEAHDWSFLQQMDPTEGAEQLIDYLSFFRGMDREKINNGTKVHTSMANGPGDGRYRGEK